MNIPAYILATFVERKSRAFCRHLYPKSPGRVSSSWEKDACMAICIRGQELMAPADLTTDVLKALWSVIADALMRTRTPKVTLRSDWDDVFTGAIDLLEIFK